MDRRREDRANSLAPWCDQCPWRRLPQFDDHNAQERDFLASFKHSHGQAPAHTELIREGESNGLMFTLFSGWAFRARWLPNGSRQILNILLPGDLIGADEYLSKGARHAVYSLTDVTFCRFDPEQIPTLFEKQPGLARKLVWQIAEQVRELETRMASMGRQIADRSLATFLLGLHARLMQRGMAGPHSYGLPLTQAQIADALGLTIVHVNRVLRRLQREGIVTVQNRQVMIHNLPVFRELAGALPAPGQPYLFL